MNPTRVSHLACYAAGAAVVAYSIEYTLTHVGAGLILPHWSLSVVLLALAALVLAIAWPVRVSAQRLREADDEQRRKEQDRGASRGRDERHGPVDPFYSIRALVAAKTSSRTGAVLFGAAVGVLLLALAPPAAYLGTVFVRLLVIAGAALVLAVCGFIAEQFCKLPPPPFEHPGDPVDGTPATGSVEREGHPADRPAPRVLPSRREPGPPNLPRAGRYDGRDPRRADRRLERCPHPAAAHVIRGIAPAQEE